MVFNDHRKGLIRQWLVMSLVGVLWCDVGGADDGSFGPFTRDLSATDWGYHEVSAGHDVMVDAPEALAEILLAAVST